MISNPYSTSTNDSVANKAMLCGRLRDLENVMSRLADQSVLLFGERRIGKTLLLYVVRDAINGAIEDYAPGLRDDDLRKWVSAGLPQTALRQRHSRCLFVSLQSYAPRSAEALAEAVARAIPGVQYVQGDRLYDVLVAADAAMQQDTIVIIDEIEEVLCTDFENTAAVFEQMNSFVQVCKRLRFVIAGADHWVRETNSRTSPIYGNCLPVFLGLPEVASITEALLRRPLADVLGDESVDAARQIIRSTGGKPYYCQALAYEIVRLGHTEGADDAMGRLDHQLRDFYDAPPEPGPVILRLLAHRPGISVATIASRLDLPKEKVQLCVADMSRLAKVTLSGEKVSIIGDVFVRWGVAYLPAPARTRVPWHRLRIVAVVALLCGGIGVFRYAHPPAIPCRWLIADGALVVELPRSVEAGERGDAVMWFEAGDDVDSIRVSNLWVRDAGIVMESASGAGWTIRGVRGGERSGRQIAKYAVPVVEARRVIGLGLSITSSHACDSVFVDVAVRRFPVKQVWAPLVAILGGASVLLAAWSQIQALLSRRV